MNSSAKYVYDCIFIYTYGCIYICVFIVLISTFPRVRLCVTECVSLYVCVCVCVCVKYA